MKDANALLSTAKETILLESNAIANLVNLLNTSFIDNVKIIYNLNKKVITNYSGYLYFDNLINLKIF